MRDLMSYANFCMKMLDEIGIPYSKVEEFTVNKRARRWGLCSLRNGKYYIQINTTLLDERNGEDGLINTIIHELLHTCHGCMNHGKMWKSYAEQVRKTYGYNIKRTSDNEEKCVTTGNLNESKREYKYFVYCKKCGKLIVKRKRRSELIDNIGRYTHTNCGGKLYYTLADYQYKTAANN